MPLHKAETSGVVTKWNVSVADSHHSVSLLPCLTKRIQLISTEPLCYWRKFVCVVEPRIHIFVWERITTLKWLAANFLFPQYKRIFSGICGPRGTGTLLLPVDTLKRTGVSVPLVSTAQKYLHSLPSTSFTPRVHAKHNVLTIDTPHEKSEKLAPRVMKKWWHWIPEHTSPFVHFVVHTCIGIYFSRGILLIGYRNRRSFTRNEK